MAASGGRMTMAAHGRQFSTKRQLSQWAPSQLLHRIPISFMWRAVKGCTVLISRLGMEFTRPQTRERLGLISAFGMGNRSLRWLSIRATRIRFLLRYLGML